MLWNEVLASDAEPVADAVAFTRRIVWVNRGGESAAADAGCCERVCDVGGAIERDGSVLRISLWENMAATVITQTTNQS